MKKDRYRILRKLIDTGLTNVDKYTHNGSTWLIFTNTREWTLELTKDRVLWYNYSFFRRLFSIATDDITIYSKYITEWVEDNLIKVDRINAGGKVYDEEINQIIDDGIKETNSWNESIIGNLNQFGCVDNVINSGVKYTDIGWHQCNNLDDTLQYGVKETKTPGGDGDIIGVMDWMFENKTNSVPEMINDVIENGVKDTKVCNYTDPNTQLMWVKWGYQIDEVIDEGIKETKVSDYFGDDGERIITDQWVIDRVIDNGDKISGTFVGGKRQKENVDVVINYGVKKTKPANKDRTLVVKDRYIQRIICDGIKNPTD